MTYLLKSQINALHSETRYATAYGILEGAIESHNNELMYASDEDFRDYISNILVLIQNELKNHKS